MKRKFKVKDIYTTKSYTEKDILNGLYGIMNKKEDIMNKREECLRMANEIVNGAREKDYGTPEDNFQFIADQWASYLNYPIDRQDVANMMILLKIARTKTGTGTDDCFIDIAGYAACAHEMNQDKHPMDDEGKEISFDDCAWGNVEYGDIHMDDYDDAETFMFHGYFPRKHDDELPDEFSDDFDMKYPCYDKFSGLYFDSNIKNIGFVIDTLNKKLRDVGFVSVGSFYHALGLKLERPTGGLGWCIEQNDHIDVSFSSRLEPDGNPCLVIDLKPIETTLYERSKDE